MELSMELNALQNHLEKNDVSEAHLILFPAQQEFELCQPALLLCPYQLLQHDHTKSLTVFSQGKGGAMFLMGTLEGCKEIATFL